MKIHFKSPITKKPIIWQESRAEQALKWGGSKAGSCFYIKETQPKLCEHLPGENNYLEPGEDIDKFLDSINFNSEKVVRGCHPLDFIGMVDVIPTKLDLRERGQVRSAILEILKEAKSEKIRSFVEYESGVPFDGNIGILVQEYCGNVRGSIVEHPHAKGIYRIALVDPSKIMDYKEEVCNEKGVLDRRQTWVKEHIYYEPWDSLVRQHNRLAGDIINLYKKIKDSGLISPDYSFQMEFGLVKGKEKRVIFYQARLFREFEESVDFEPNEKNKDQFSAWTYSYNSFGITPEEGIEITLPKVISHGLCERSSFREGANIKNAGYFYSSFGHRQSTGLDVQPTNMTVFFPWHQTILEHGYFRWIQKAPVSLLGLGYAKLGEQLSSISSPQKARVISNGIKGVLNFKE